MSWRKWTWSAAAGLWAGAQMAWGAYEGAGTFTRITSRDDLTEGYYVVASSNGLAAMTHTNAGTYFTSNAVVPVDNVLTDPPGAIVWLLQTNAAQGGLTIFNEASNRYVAYAGTANAAHAVVAVNGTTGTWTFTYVSNAFYAANVANSARVLQYNAGSPRFACYTTSQQKLALYKMGSSGQAPAFTGGAGPYAATSGVALAFTVAASGSPAPALALQGTTASSGYVFTAGTGVLEYTPPTNDVGTQTFTFTASNSLGVATQVVSVAVTNVPDSAPLFGANPGPVAATATVAAAFTVSAGGVPMPGLSLQGTTASSGYAFTAGTGVLDYTPSTNDVGTQTFTFAASNRAGVALQTVSVSVASAPAAIPVVSITNIGTNSFTANWTACAGATNYQVQVATDTNFTVGSTGNALSEDFATQTDTAVPAGWTASGASDLDYASEPYAGGAAPAFKFSGTGQWLATPVFSTGATNLQFFAYGNGGSGSTIAVSGLVGGVWALLDTVSVAQNDGTYDVSLDPQTTQLRFGFTKVVNCGFDDVVVQASGAGGSLVADATVAALTYGATGLAMSTTYRVRARKQGGEWSGVVAATTADPSPTVPVFGANPGPVAATATVAAAFTVSASGFPSPALSLYGTTASSGYTFTAGTGGLAYTPPTNDVGTRTFTFAASNSAGVSWQTVSVSVASAPVYLPTVSVTNIGTNSFMATWTEVTGATTYQIQIGTDTNFTATVEGSNLVNETFAALTDTALPGGWTGSASSDLDYTTYFGASSPSFKFATDRQWLASPVFATGATNLQFWAYGIRSGNTITVSGRVSGVWTLVGTVSIARNGATYDLPLDPLTTQIQFAFSRVNNNTALDDVVVQRGATAGSLVADEVVAALSYGATGLDLATLYHLRVRSVPMGTWSEVESVSTLGNDPLAPWFTGGAGPYSTTAGVAVAFSVSAMGVPGPVLALAGTTAAAGSHAFTAETGYLLYVPPLGDAGVQTFTFTASNGMGVATQTVSVAVAAAMAPEFLPVDAQTATTGVTKVFIVEAAGAPEPVLALAGTTATAGYSFSPEAGRLSYTPPTNDVGTRIFTFTASNLAGVATQAVNVAVTLPPPAAPVIDPIPAQATMVGLALEYTVTATDADTPASNLTFACTSTVAVLTWDFDTATGYFLFEPTTNQIGTNNVFTFTASDGAHTSAPVVLVVSVNSAADPVAVSLGGARFVGAEGGTLAIPVNLAYSGTAAVQFRFSGPTNGTAQRGVDFTCETNLLISGASSGNLVVTLGGDLLAEGPETVKVTLVPVSPATAGAVTQAVLHIRDADTVSILAANTTSGSNQEYEGPGNRIFQALCPDVVLIQEFNMTNGTTEAAYRGWVDENFGTNYEYCVQTGVSIPNGVVSRWPIVSWDVWDDTTLADRDFVWATIDLPGTQNLHAVSLHIKASSGSADVSQRTAEARALTNYIAQAGWLTNGYIAVGGDFNLYTTNETALQVLTAKTVTDRHQPADQFGDKETNSARDNPYDRVLPSTNLDARHRSYSFGGYTYANGIVFDSRITWASGIPSPVLAADSGAANMQHMAVMKVFELEKEAAMDAPQAFTAEASGADWIDLAFTRNGLEDDVVIVWDGDGTFTAPTGTVPAAGAAFAGGTVLYKGSVSPQSHTGLTACSTYHYRCWSYAGSAYSTNALDAVAATAEPAAPASVRASVTNNEGFTAAWSAVAGAAGYRLDVCAAPSFSGAGQGWGPVFRETMGTPAAGTTLLADHEAANGFDRDAYAMTDGGAANPADVRTSTASTNYMDPAGAAASGGANIYFPTNGLTGASGFAIGGIDTRGYEGLLLSFGYYKESAATNMGLGVDWSKDGGSSWNPVAVSNALPAGGAAAGWYMVSNLVLDAAALESTNLSLRWVRQAGSVPGRVDDVLLQGNAESAEFVPGYSNRTVTGATSQTVTGLTGGVTYYFRVRTAGGCEGADSAVASVTPPGTPAAPVFGANPGPVAATTGVEAAFTVAIAAGYPKPVLALADASASSGYVFSAGTGQLAYTPPEADVGTNQFVFTATNIYGMAAQTVTVIVAAGVPSAPAQLWASATNAAEFTAEWSASSLATGYRLDVSRVEEFQVSGGGSVQSVLATNAATSVELITGGWTGTALGGTNGYVQMTQSTATVVSPAFSAAGCTNLMVDFWARTYGGSASSNITVSISTNNGADWRVMGVVAPGSGSAWVAMPTLGDTAGAGHAQTRIRWQSLDANGTSGVGVRYLSVRGWGPGFTPSFVAGYSNRAVSGTSQTVTGLAELTPYYFRVRAENGSGAGGFSAMAAVTTKELQWQNQTIEFPAIGAQVATNELELAATASSGLPVSFAVGSGPAVIASDTTLSFTGAGAVSIVASQAGAAGWHPAPEVTNTFSVAKASAGVALRGLARLHDGTPKSVGVQTDPEGLAVAITYDGGATVPSAIGQYAVTAQVEEARFDGLGAGTLTIESATNRFESWLADDQAQDPQDPDFASGADVDDDGATTWEEFVADTDPGNPADVLVLTGRYVAASEAGGGTGEIRFSFPASTGRFYQLEYCTDLTNRVVGTSNLGRGVSGMVVTNRTTGTWYGVIRAWLEDPDGP